MKVEKKMTDEEFIAYRDKIVSKNKVLDNSKYIFDNKGHVIDLQALLRKDKAASAVRAGNVKQDLQD